jgi:hypothetical protein
MKKYLQLGAALLTVLAATASAEPVIQSITISGNRVRESVVKANLGFREGDRWDDSLVEKGKRNLFRLKIFKELDISAETSVSSDTVNVNVRAVDGWFILPLPMMVSQGGEQRFILLLSEQNLWRSAERMTAFSSFREGGTSLLFTVSLGDYSFTAGEKNNAVTEYAYADAGFSDKDFDRRGSNEKPGDLGTVIADYNKEVTEPLLMAGKRISEGIRASVGLKSTKVSYRQGSSGAALPDDGGTMNAVTFGMNSEERDTIRPNDSLGRMFGLGMAEVKELIRTGKREPSAWLWNIGVENSGRLLSSDLPYTKTTLSLARKTVFSRRNTLTASTRFSAGTSLPSSQMPATNQENGLRGYYAREFRGDSAVNSYLSYAHPLYMTMTGYFVIESFYDWGVCFFDGARRDRQGTGLNLSYRFWRFPLPIGFGFTYSFDDENWQTSFSVGGRF